MDFSYFGKLDSNPSGLVVKQRILIVTDWFDPAFKAGGPITSVINFCASLSAEFELFVLTSDHDLDQTDKLEVPKNQWVDWQHHVKVYYAGSPLSPISYRKLVQRVTPDFIYLNSMFSMHYTLIPLLMMHFLSSDIKVILNPRGMLLPRALEIKSFKKKLFLSLVRKLPIWRRIVWQHTSTEEERWTRKKFGEKINSVIVGNFYPEQFLSKHLPKVIGEVRLIFVGRVHPIKNLKPLLEAFKGIKKAVTLSIYGSQEHQEYYRKCLSLAKKLPNSVRVEFYGPKSREHIRKQIANHHFLVLPSQSENFGHVICEAWACARPVLISKHTPWKNLEEKGLGWDVEVEDLSKKIEVMLDMDEVHYQALCQRSTHFMQALKGDESMLETYRHLFSM